MEQIGTVIKTEGKFAKVTVNRATSCGENCAHCKGGCTPTKVVAMALNSLQAQAGDTVKIESNTQKVILAELLLYFAPIILTIIAAIALYTNGISALYSVIAFFVPFFVIKKYEGKLLPIPQITKILKKGTN